MERDNQVPKNRSLSNGVGRYDAEHGTENNVSVGNRGLWNGIPFEKEVCVVDRKGGRENGERDVEVDGNLTEIQIGDDEGDAVKPNGISTESDDSDSGKIAVDRDAVKPNGIPTESDDSDSGKIAVDRDAVKPNGIPNESDDSDSGKIAVDRDAVKHNGILTESDDSDSGTSAVDPPINSDHQLLRPLSHLPQPEAPPGLDKSASNGEDHRAIGRSLSESSPAVDLPSFGKFLRDRSNNLSASITKRISSLKEFNGYDHKVTEIHLPGLKVIVQLKKDGNRDLDLKGRISFFSRSNCRDCTAVRSFFREKGLKFVEINVDVYPQREKDLIQRSGSASVPQIFFNEKLLGGLVVLNSLRNSGELEKRMRDMMGRKCPESAPHAPVYGFDDVEDEPTDEMIGIIRTLRQRLPIQDRLTKMKIVKNCFAGSEMVEVIIQQLDCGRKKAVEVGKVLARKHFIHHVFGENDFEDGNHFYRFLEHDPTIPRCFNFRGSTNDSEPKPAAVVGQKLTKIMSAILEAYASDDRCHLDYNRISNSEEFRRYVNLIQDLQRVNVLALSADEKVAFFMNLYNAMVIHAVIRIGRPEGVIDRRTFYGDFHYIIGGFPYSLAAIKNGILRCNRRQPYSLVRPFSNSDKRLEVSSRAYPIPGEPNTPSVWIMVCHKGRYIKVAVPKVNPLIHFGLCNGTRSSPTVRFFSAQGLEAELRFAAREFFLGNGIEVDLEKRTVHLTRIIKWYSIDFGQEKEILKWLLNYLDATKAGLLTYLLNDGGPVNIVYQNYDWSLNSA